MDSGDRRFAGGRRSENNLRKSDAPERSRMVRIFGAEMCRRRDVYLQYTMMMM